MIKVKKVKKIIDKIIDSKDNIPEYKNYIYNEKEVSLDIFDKNTNFLPTLLIIFQNIFILTIILF